jgi:hypothetical protein
MGIGFDERREHAVNVGLVKYDAMCKAIAACYSVDEAKEIRDRAEALEVYAKEANNLDAERKACGIRIRAERRVGELLKDMKQNGQRHSGHGDQKSESSHATPIQTLEDFGITRDQSSKWQQLADVPEQTFENLVTEDGMSTEEILRRMAPPTPPPSVDLRVLFVWSHLKDFASGDWTGGKPVLESDPKAVVDLMEPGCRRECAKLAPQVVAWLTKLGKEAENGKN